MIIDGTQTRGPWVLDVPSDGQRRIRSFCCGRIRHPRTEHDCVSTIPETLATSLLCLLCAALKIHSLYRRIPTSCGGYAWTTDAITKRPDVRSRLRRNPTQHFFDRSVNGPNPEDGNTPVLPPRRALPAQPLYVICTPSGRPQCGRLTPPQVRRRLDPRLPPPRVRAQRATS